MTLRSGWRMVLRGLQTAPTQGVWQVTQGRSPNAPSDAWRTRYRVWRAGLGARPARFSVPPEPRSIGSASVGRQICEGHVLLAGQQVALQGDSIWAVPIPDPAAEADRHGFTWLDDLAAAGTREATKIAQTWLSAWLHVYGAGKGPGWRPDVAARRLVRWIHHSGSLLDGLPPETEALLRQGLTRHVLYLSRHWRAAPRGCPHSRRCAGLFRAGWHCRGWNPGSAPA